MRARVAAALALAACAGCSWAYDYGGDGRDATDGGSDSSGQPGSDAGPTNQCTAPFASCTTGPACQTNLMTDSSNCGACGVSCSGAKCNSGVCDLQIYRDNAASLSAVATNGSFVFTGANGGAQVYRLPLPFTSNATPAVISTGIAQFSTRLRQHGIAADGAYVYWGNADSGAFYSAPVGGGTVHTVAPQAGLVSLGPDGVYFAVPSAGTVWYTSTRGQTTPVQLASSLATIVDLAADPAGGAVWVASVGTDGNSGLFKVTRPPGSSFLAGRPGKITSLAVDSTYLYFTDDRGEVFLQPKAPGVAGNVLVASQGVPSSLVLTPDSVLYWIAGGANVAGSIVRGRGNPPSLLSTSMPPAFWVAVTSREALVLDGADLYRIGF